MDRVHRLIKHDTIPPKSVVQLLKDTYIGTEGTLYQLLDTESKISQLNKPHFFYIERNQRAVGNITICERDVLLNDQTHSSFYIRYFAFDRTFQSSSKKGNGKSLFHDYFRQLFATNNLNPTSPQFGKNLFWAFIDPQNLRSFNMNQQFGFQTIGSFKTTAFSAVPSSPSWV